MEEVTQYTLPGKICPLRSSYSPGDKLREARCIEERCAVWVSNYDLMGKAIGGYCGLITKK